MQGKVLDLVGQRFGHLTVINRTAERGRGSYWNVVCDCGERRVVAGKSIAARTSCGCTTGEAAIIDLTGQRFSKLTVLKIAHRRSGAIGGVTWLCRCDCGQKTKVRGRDLPNGNTTSCGCARRVGRSKRSGRLGTLLAVGSRYGELCISGEPEHRGGFRYYPCTCSCGETTTVRAALLTRGQTKSCGCLRLRGAELRRDRLNEARKEQAEAA